MNNYIDYEVGRDTAVSGEVRKIQFTGKSTYIISLPKKWVRDMGLKAGDQFFLSKRGESIVLTPKELVKPKPQSMEATINILSKEDTGAIARKIIAAYLLGYNLIIVNAGGEHITSAQRNSIKDLVRKKLVGTEIIADSINEIRLQVLLSYPELSVQNALRRMCLITVSMYEDALKALKAINKELAREVVQLDDEVDRFGFYILRQLKAAVGNESILKGIGIPSPRACLGYRVVVKFVERVADHSVKIAENIFSLEKKPSEAFITSLYEIGIYSRNLFNDSVKALFSNDYQLAENVVSKSKAIVPLENELIRTISSRIEPKMTSNLRMMVESIRRTAEYAGDIAEVVLNLNVDQLLS
ncbi:MAG: PhoU domain-containing protein [Thermoproteota archaeon]